MGTLDRLQLGIRTIVVSARAAIRSNHQTGRPDLAVASARRGLAMLEQLRDRLPADAPDVVLDHYERARRELTKAADDPVMTSFRVGEESTEASPGRRERSDAADATTSPDRPGARR